MTSCCTADSAPRPARPCRVWALTGSHNGISHLRLAGAANPPAPAPDEHVTVVELGSWRAVWAAVHAAIRPPAAAAAMVGGPDA